MWIPEILGGKWANWIELCHIFSVAGSLPRRHFIWRWRDIYPLHCQYAVEAYGRLPMLLSCACELSHCSMSHFASLPLGLCGIWHQWYQCDVGEGHREFGS